MTDLPLLCEDCGWACIADLSTNPECDSCGGDLGPYAEVDAKPTHPLEPLSNYRAERTRAMTTLADIAEESESLGLPIDVSLMVDTAEAHMAYARGDVPDFTPPTEFTVRGIRDGRWVVYDDFQQSNQFYSLADAQRVPARVRGGA